jgi:hypothetical protein
MTDNRTTAKLAAIIGVVVALALVVIFVSGGEHVGKKTINSDADLPPIATGAGQSKSR